MCTTPFAAQHDDTRARQEFRKLLAVSMNHTMTNLNWAAHLVKHANK